MAQWSVLRSTVSVPSQHQTSHWLTICDVNTRIGMAIPIRRETTENIAYQIVHRWIMLYGFPKCIISDNGPGFASAVMKRCRKLLDVKVKFILPYRPQSNGICERLNDTLKSMLGSYTQKSQKEWCYHTLYLHITQVCMTQKDTHHTIFYTDGRRVLVGREGSKIDT
jgi:transposase InsO family protein